MRHLAGMPSSSTNQITQWRSKWREALSTMSNNEILNAIIDMRNSLEGRIDNLENRMDNLESTVADMNGRLTRVENRMDKLESRMDKLESRMDKMEYRMDKMEYRMDKMENTLTGVRSDTVKLLSKVDGLEFSSNDLLRLSKFLVMEATKSTQSKLGFLVEWHLQSKLKALYGKDYTSGFTIYNVISGIQLFVNRNRCTLREHHNLLLSYSKTVVNRSFGYIKDNFKKVEEFNFNIFQNHSKAVEKIFKMKDFDPLDQSCHTNSIVALQVCVALALSGSSTVEEFIASQFDHNISERYAWLVKGSVELDCRGKIELNGNYLFAEIVEIKSTLKAAEGAEPFSFYSAELTKAMKDRCDSFNLVYTNAMFTKPSYDPLETACKQLCASLLVYYMAVQLSSENNMVTKLHLRGVILVPGEEKDRRTDTDRAQAIVDELVGRKDLVTIRCRSC